MKKSHIIFPLALALLLTGCGEENDSSSSVSGSSESDSSSASSSSSSSSSVNDELTIEDLESDAANAVDHFSNVASGSLSLREVTSWGDETTVTDYEYGSDKNGPAFHFSGADYSGDYDMYVFTDENGELVTIKKDSSDEYSKPYSQYDDIGYSFEGFFGYDSEIKGHGAEGFLTALVTAAKINPNKNFQASKKDGSPSFSFGYFEGEDVWNYYLAEVSYALNADGALTKLDATISTYGNTSFTVDFELGTVILNEGAVADTEKTFAITQTIGERTYVNPIDMDAFCYSSFDLLDEEDNKIDENSVITFSYSENYTLSVANALPETADPSIDEFVVSVIDGDADVNGSYWLGEITLNAFSTGTCKVKVATAKVTKTFSVTVTEPLPESIGLTCYTVSPNGYEPHVVESEQSSLDAYVGVKYYFCPSVYPYGSSQDVSVSVDGGAISKQSVQVSQYGDPIDLYEFTPTEEKEYTLTITSSALSSVTRNISIDATSITLKDALSKKFAVRNGGPVKYSFEFSDVADNGLTGTVTINDLVDNKNEVASFTLTLQSTGNYAFGFTKTSGDELHNDFFSLQVGADFGLYIIFEQSEYGNYATALSEATPAFYLTQSWRGSDNGYTLGIALGSDGVAQVNIQTPDYDYDQSTCLWSCAEKDGEEGYNVILSEKADGYNSVFPSLPFTMSANASLTSVTASFAYNGTALNFTLSYASGRGM